MLQLRGVVLTKYYNMSTYIINIRYVTVLGASWNMGLFDIGKGILVVHIAHLWQL
jgi:hypothetical protein